MGKNVNFGFYTIKAIHKKKGEQELNLLKLLNQIENRPLDINKQGHRYYSINDECQVAISHFQYSNNDILLTLRKWKIKNIKGSFLGDGIQKFDVGDVLNKNFKRNDSTTIEENFLKIFDNGIMIFQIYRLGISPNQFKAYLEEFIKDYRFEIFPIYRDDLFEQIENGNIKNITINVGFSPKGSSFDVESYSGAAEIQLCFKKPRGKSLFLNLSYIKDILSNRKTSNFGQLDKGNIKKGSIKLENDSIIKLDDYELREVKIFEDDNFDIISKETLFNELYRSHKNFLENYLDRDTRYS